MTLKVRVIPKARVNKVEESGAGGLKVHLTTPAQDNKANKALIELLAGYYGLKKKQVRIVRGEKSRDKVVEIGKEK